MEYECGPLFLYSQDKIRMMDFLSDVFEFDVDSVSDSINRDRLAIKLFHKEEENEKLHNGNSGIVFSFKVKKEEELKEIMSKYNFFLYRKSSPSTALEKLDLIQDEHKKILMITDIDQRLWRFEFEPRTDN